MADLRVRLKKQEFERLEGEALCLRCIQPTIDRVRGTSLAVRQHVYDELLTPGLQALLAFWVVYTHGAHGWTQLHAELSHLVEHDYFWNNIRSATRYFGLPRMLESTEQFLRVMRQPGKPNSDELVQADASLLKVLPDAVKTVSAFIRAHPVDFVRFEE
uniref:Uncharacterized protein n=1 Tax=Pyxidicoccus sp. MCy9557 TaxID=2012863 RepID=A0A1Z2TJL8_9BACT|nr:hypothetical protein [Pyxidicoccus sp. MCy9557]